MHILVGDIIPPMICRRASLELGGGSRVLVAKLRNVQKLQANGLEA